MINSLRRYFRRQPKALSYVIRAVDEETHKLLNTSFCYLAPGDVLNLKEQSTGRTRIQVKYTLSKECIVTVYVASLPQAEQATAQEAEISE